MKKLIFLVTGSLLFASCSLLSTELKISDLEVGDPMPRFDETYERVNFGRWSKGDKKGSFVKYDKKDSPIGLWENKFYVGDGKIDYMEVNVICHAKASEKPFGISNFWKGLVYLD